MADRPNGARHLAETLAELADLVIAADHLPGVTQNFERLLSQARIVIDLELPPDIQPAPVFRP